MGVIKKKDLFSLSSCLGVSYPDGKIGPGYDTAAYRPPGSPNVKAALHPHRVQSIGGVGGHYHSIFALFALAAGCAVFYVWQYNYLKHHKTGTEPGNNIGSIEPEKNITEEMP